MIEFFFLNNKSDKVKYQSDTMLFATMQEVYNERQSMSNPKDWIIVKIRFTNHQEIASVIYSAGNAQKAELSDYKIVEVMYDKTEE